MGEGGREGMREGGRGGGRGGRDDCCAHEGGREGGMTVVHIII